MSELKSKIDLEKLPKHVAVIMDGNGRWAKAHGKPRIFGHQNGVKAVREITEAAAEIGIEYLTLYAFSTENWNRPKLEVNALMHLLVQTVRNELKTLNENGIKLQAIGDISKLPSKTQDVLLEGIKKTAQNSRMTLTLALNYSSRWEILNAVKKITEESQADTIEPSKIDESYFESHLSTKNLPDPELMIRTSGEQRISNFLLWQLAYAELYFTEIFWPEFRKQHLYEALVDFQSRERRFGKISEQL
ncbi:MAG: isoprenyl transferase [Saprospiraceae bacterium]|nr:isoprenyl transferase [Saprospiraceae bacterium]NNL90794.1 isoprenyl transferase [Saprospiraceae bacterium]